MQNINFSLFSSKNKQNHDNIQIFNPNNVITLLGNKYIVNANENTQPNTFKSGGKDVILNKKKFTHTKQSDTSSSGHDNSLTEHGVNVNYHTVASLFDNKNTQHKIVKEQTVCVSNKFVSKNNNNIIEDSNADAAVSKQATVNYDVNTDLDNNNNVYDDNENSISTQEEYNYNEEPDVTYGSNQGLVFVNNYSEDDNDLNNGKNLINEKGNTTAEETGLIIETGISTDDEEELVDEIQPISQQDNNNDTDDTLSTEDVKNSDIGYSDNDVSEK